MTILDNILLYLLSKYNGETLEKRSNNLTFITFLLGTALLFASLVSLMFGVITNSFFSQGGVFQFFISFFVLGIFFTFLNCSALATELPPNFDTLTILTPFSICIVCIFYSNIYYITIFKKINEFSEKSKFYLQ